MKELFNGIKGDLEFFSVVKDKWTPIHKQQNMIVTEGASILASALAGNRKVDTMYLVFRNADGALDIVADTDNKVTDYTVESANRGTLRIPILGDPVFTSSEEYSNNIITFLGVSDVSESWGASLMDGSSTVYHTALASSDKEGADLIFSCADITVPITKIIGAQIGIKWNITFNRP